MYDSCTGMLSGPKWGSHPMKSLRLALVVCSFLPFFLNAAPDINVVVDMTAEGRKIVHPTTDHPAYYQPVMRGNQQMGDPVSGEKPVSPEEVYRITTTELAQQGYLIVDAQHPNPNLIIDLAWGYITPTEEPDPRNQNQREALVLGDTITNVAQLESVGHEELMEATRDPRYFVVVTAFDYDAWAKKHRHVILWKAKMSIPTSGVFLGDVVLPLVKAGGPLFGRETINRPKLVPVPEGKVEVGTPTVRNEPAAPPTVPQK
jgi:hypothetical protein